jgi:hypothetical protein
MTDLSNNVRHLLARYTLQKGFFVSIQESEQTFCAEKGADNDQALSYLRAGEGMTHKQITEVAVSERERTGNTGIVYAGTEPSTLFRSEDGGDSWRELTELREVTSAPTWIFPRPSTSHIRWIMLGPLMESCG